MSPLTICKDQLTLRLLLLDFPFVYIDLGLPLFDLLLQLLQIRRQRRRRGYRLRLVQGCLQLLLLLLELFRPALLISQSVLVRGGILLVLAQGLFENDDLRVELLVELL